VGFVLITQYLTSIPPEVRNAGTYFIMSAMSETEIQRFREVTLHLRSKVITRLPRSTSFYLFLNARFEHRFKHR